MLLITDNFIHLIECNSSFSISYLACKLRICSSLNFFLIFICSFAKPFYIKIQKPVRYTAKPLVLLNVYCVQLTYLVVLKLRSSIIFIQVFNEKFLCQKNNSCMKIVNESLFIKTLKKKYIFVHHCHVPCNYY